MRILFFILLQFFAAFVWSVEENFDDRIVNYLVSFIEQNEAYNDSLIQRGEAEKVNRTIYIDFSEILQDEPRILKAYATEVVDMSSEFLKTKKSSDIFNTIQDQIKFYNVIIGAMPDYFKIIQQPSTYRYGNKIANTGGYYDSYSGYYSIGNYYGANQETLYKLMRNTLTRVSEVVEVGENVVFNYFAFTKKQTPKKPIYINFVHTDFVGDLFVPHLQDLKTDLTGMMAGANSSVYSNSQYSLDDKLNYHLGASVKVLLNKRSEENSILELAILEGDAHDDVLPWNCEHHESGAHIHGAHILTQFLQDNGFYILTNTNATADDPPTVYAAQEQEGGGFIEYEVQFRAGMSQDEVWEILTNWGVTNNYDYCCYRFGDNSNRNFTDWISWYDNYALETPPFVVELIARLVAGPFLSIYGYINFEDAITGEKLEGLDYFLNAFDLIPAAGFLSDALNLGVKSVKFKNAAGMLIGNTSDFVKKIPTKLYTFVKEMSSKALALMPKANGALVVVAKETSGAVREILEFGADQVIKVLREIDPGMAPPQVVYDLGGVSVRQGDQIVERQLQIVKTGDGQVFVRSVASLSNRLANHPNLLSWYNAGMPDNLINKIDELEDVDLIKLETDIGHEVYGSEIKFLLEENPEDLLLIWKKLKDEPAFSWEIQKTGGSRWEKWSQREFFKNITFKGKYFETNVCLEAFKNRSSSNYLQLKNLFQNDFNKNLDDYDLYSQVQLKYEGENYFVADQVFVKRITIGGQLVVDDILILENKLSINTPLTTPQSNAFTKTSFIVRSQNVQSEFSSGQNLISGDIIDFANTKQWYKVHDGSDGNIITGIIKME